MANYSGGANTICPFYISETKNTLTCEGLHNKSLIITRFTDSSSKRQWQMEKCENFRYGKSCPFAAALNEKYQADT